MPEGGRECHKTIKFSPALEPEALFRGRKFNLKPESQAHTFSPKPPPSSFPSEGARRSQEEPEEARRIPEEPEGTRR
jgi:hypothetical protein